VGFGKKEEGTSGLIDKSPPVLFSKPVLFLVLLAGGAEFGLRQLDRIQADTKNII
jgi:hypothetical protein